MCNLVLSIKYTIPLAKPNIYLYQDESKTNWKFNSKKYYSLALVLIFNIIPSLFHFFNKLLISFLKETVFFIRTKMIHSHGSKDQDYLVVVQQLITETSKATDCLVDRMSSSVNLKRFESLRRLLDLILTEVIAQLTVVHYFPFHLQV